METLRGEKEFYWFKSSLKKGKRFVDLMGSVLCLSKSPRFSPQEFTKVQHLEKSSDYFGLPLEESYYENLHNFFVLIILLIITLCQKSYIIIYTKEIIL